MWNQIKPHCLSHLNKQVLTAQWSKNSIVFDTLKTIAKVANLLDDLSLEILSTKYMHKEVSVRWSPVWSSFHLHLILNQQTINCHFCLISVERAEDQVYNFFSWSHKLFFPFFFFLTKRRALLRMNFRAERRSIMVGTDLVWLSIDRTRRTIVHEELL